jgi:hypothetical protein
MKIAWAMCGITVVSSLAAAPAAKAGPIQSVSFTDTIPMTTTTWFDTLSVPKFDPALGTLLGIDFSLTGTVSGSAAYESLDADPATITLNLTAEVVVQRPDLSQLIVVLPVVNVVENSAAFDGTIDFDGPSGSTFTNLNATLTNTASSPPPASDLVLFTGPGTINLPVSASGMSSGSGAGNLILQFATSAEAEFTVTYHYLVPEPATLAMLAGGAIPLFRRRRPTR